MTNDNTTHKIKMMTITACMAMAMVELKSTLADTLDDDYPDTIDSVMSQYEMSDEQADYCVKNYLDA